MVKSFKKFNKKLPKYLNGGLSSYMPFIQGGIGFINSLTPPTESPDYGTDDYQQSQYLKQGRVDAATNMAASGLNLIAPGAGTALQASAALGKAIDKKDQYGVSNSPFQAAIGSVLNPMANLGNAAEEFSQGHIGRGFLEALPGVSGVMQNKQNIIDRNKLQGEFMVNQTKDMQDVYANKVKRAETAYMAEGGKIYNPGMDLINPNSNFNSGIDPRTGLNFSGNPYISDFNGLDEKSNIRSRENIPSYFPEDRPSISQNLDIKNNIKETKVEKPYKLVKSTINNTKSTDNIINSPFYSKAEYDDIINRQVSDYTKYHNFMKQGNDIVNRTDIGRNKDSEKYIEDVLKSKKDSNTIIIDIGSALGNKDSNLAGVTVKELYDNPNIIKKAHIIATDIPSEIKKWNNLKNHYNIDVAEVSDENFNTDILKILRDKNLNSDNLILRSANSIDLLMNRDQTLEHFNHIANTLKNKEVTYIFNNSILYKPANETKFKLKAKLNNAAFDHKSGDGKDWNTNKNRKSYTILFANGGIAKPNAEVEKEENAITPDNTFLQFNGPSHDNGGIPTSLPPDTVIFSDKLKPKGVNKTYAQLNKVNNTTKQDSIINNVKANPTTKKTAELMKKAKSNNSAELFNQQEQQKIEKANNYMNRIGLKYKFSNGGPVPKVNFTLPPLYVNSVNDPRFRMFNDSMTVYSHPYIDKALTDSKAPNSQIINEVNKSNNAYARLHKANGVPPTEVAITNDNMHLYNPPKQQVIVKPPTPPTTNVTPVLGTPPTQPEIPVEPTKTVVDMSAKTVSKQPMKQYSITGKKGETLEEMQKRAAKFGMDTTNTTFNVKFAPGGIVPDGIPYSDQTLDFQNSLGWGNMEPGNVNPGYGNQNINYMQPGMRPEIMGYNVLNTPYGNFPFPKVGVHMDPLTQPANDTTLRIPASYNPADTTLADKALTEKPRFKFPTMTDQQRYNMGQSINQNLGELSYLAGEGKSYDTQQYHTYNPSYMSNKQELRAIDQQGLSAQQGLASGANGNAGNYMANIAALKQRLAGLKAGSIEKTNNYNNQLDNQAKMTNLQNRYMVDDINSKNKGQALTDYYAAIERMGTNNAMLSRDNRMYQMDVNRMNLIHQMYPSMQYNPTLQKQYQSWYR